MECTPLFSERDPRALRKHLRQRRDAIAPAQRRSAARSASRNLAHWREIHHAQDIACYLSVNAEFPTTDLIRWLWGQGKRLYLPVLQSGRHKRILNFQRYTPFTRLRRNRLKIWEPVGNPRDRISATALDLVITPLVGFDPYGNRIGMGGGYYDRTFAFLLRPGRQRPRLLGMAFEAQRVTRIVAEHWDVPLHGVVTERGLTVFPRRPRAG
ncbi:MAG: 5-formyltetrahydrofolate cyclo-ligase [Thiotrichales bacterium]